MLSRKNMVTFLLLSDSAIGFFSEFRRLNVVDLAGSERVTWISWMGQLWGNSNDINNLNINIYIIDIYKHK
jgi:hypothetical protein